LNFCSDQPRISRSLFHNIIARKICVAAQNSHTFGKHSGIHLISPILGGLIEACFFLRARGGKGFDCRAPPEVLVLRIFALYWGFGGTRFLLCFEVFVLSWILSLLTPKKQVFKKIGGSTHK